jgi:importin subunit beta-1
VLAIGALADATGPDFVDHMPILLQYFNVKLLFPIYLRVIGNIFCVLGERILPYCDGIMDVLFRGLSKPTLKPAILECFGEIALAIGKNFEKYLQAVVKRLKDSADPEYYDDVLEEDEVDYSNQLRQGIFKAYSGIIRGIKDPESGLKVAADLVEFTQAVCKDQSRCASSVCSRFLVIYIQVTVSHAVILISCPALVLLRACMFIIFIVLLLFIYRFLFLIIMCIFQG